MSGEEKRLALILALALLLWMTDSLHGLRAGWVALAAGLACLLPRVGVLPPTPSLSFDLGPLAVAARTLYTRRMAARGRSWRTAS
mgnify:CR=1 FL=1